MRKREKGNHRGGWDGKLNGGKYCGLGSSYLYGRNFLLLHETQ